MSGSDELTFDLPQEEPVSSAIVVQSLAVQPLVLVDEGFIAHLESVEKQSAQLAVKDDATLQSAATILNEITKAVTQVNKQRLALKAPFKAKMDEIDTVAAQVTDRISKIRSVLDPRMLAYRAEQDRIAQEAEEKRLAEIARLQRIEREQAEAKRKADEAAAELIRKAAEANKAPPPEEMSFESPPEEQTPVQKQIEQVKAAVVAPPASKPVGVRWIVTCKFEVFDELQLPPEYQIVSANEVKIRGLTMGWKEGQKMPYLPGVRFYEDRKVAGTGR
jgi:vacuolar-type H+-ATPase subunit I/STV1